MKSVQDAIVLITGGAGGIGRLMGLDFAARGAKLVAWDLNEAALQNLEEEGRRRGFFIRGMICDVSDREEVYRQAARVRADIGPVDILVNNAGVVSGSTLLETPDDRIIRSLNVNTLALFWTCKAFLPSMIERNTGHLVTISSAAGLIGVTGLADYSASKFGAFGFHEAVRMELRRAKRDIQTTVVCPFYIDTGMFQGVKTKFPRLLPILKRDYAAGRIVKAVLKNRKRLIMPRFVYGVLGLRLFPTGFFDYSADFWGINHSMEDFIGRERRA